MQIDLEGMPFVDGHMHAPLAVRPATADEYAWPSTNGMPSRSICMATPAGC